MREADHRGLGDFRVRDQRAFHFRRADAVAADVDDVVDAAGDPVVPVGVATATVAGEVAARIRAEVGVEEALGVAVDAAHLPRPRIGQHQVALGRALEHGAVGIDQRRLHAEEGLGRRAGLEVDRAGQRRDQDAAGLGLPPGVDDRATAVADDFVVPAPGLGIDRLADRAQQAQRLPRGLLHRLVAIAHQRADRGRRGVEDRDLVLVDHLPQTRHVRPGRQAFEQHRGGAVGQRAVDDVAVAGDPADVGGAPVDVVLAQVEHHLVGVGGVDQVTTGGVQHALGLAGAAGGVEDEQRILGIHALGLALDRLRIDDGVIPAVARHLHVDRGMGVAHHQHGLDRLGARQFQRGIDVGLQRDLLAAAQALVGGDDQLAAAVGNAVGDRVRRETAEHHHVDGAHARAGEHRDHGFRDHRQVDRDPIALAHTELAQRIGQLAYARMQVAIADALGRQLRVVVLEDQRGLVATRGQVAVEAVDARVELAVGVPADAEIVELEAGVLDLGRHLHPVQPLRHAAPERVGLGDGFGVQPLVVRARDPRLRGEVRDDRIDGGGRVHGALRAATAGKPKCAASTPAAAVVQLRRWS